MINQYFSDQAVTHLNSSRIDGFTFEGRARKFMQKLANSSGNITMGVRGDWGVGKTSFLKTMQRVGLAKAHSYFSEEIGANQNEEGKVQAKDNQEKDEKYAERCFPIFFNAWQYEREDNPLAALCGNIVNQLSSNRYFLERAKNNEKLKNILTNFFNQYLYIGAKSLAQIEDSQSTIQSLAQFIQQNPSFKSSLKNDQNMEWIRVKNQPEFQKLLD